LTEENSDNFDLYQFNFSIVFLKKFWPIQTLKKFKNEFGEIRDKKYKWGVQQTKNGSCNNMGKFSNH
jgi:hypothetical protein